MELKVSGVAEKQQYKDCYVVECEAMYGDADGYDTLTFGGFYRHQVEILKDLVVVCERMKNAYPNGKGGKDYYDESTVEGYNRWFNQDNLSQEEYDALPEKQKWMADYWLNDPTGFDDTEAKFEDYNIYYYDADGVKYNVEVIM